jgi:hypothetical protein
MPRKTAAQRRAEHEQQRRDRDLEMMRSDKNWPMWPILPLKKWNREKHSFDCGYLEFLAGSVVFKANLHTAREIETEKLKYASLEAIIADGWTVD